jgi:hypothetical protein
LRRYLGTTSCVWEGKSANIKVRFIADKATFFSSEGSAEPFFSLPMPNKKAPYGFCCSLSVRYGQNWRDQWVAY